MVPQAVRFLAENAASMLEMHYKAFCRLLNIDLTPPDKYLWNPSDMGYQITRRRNFFRNFDDVEGVPLLHCFLDFFCSTLLRCDLLKSVGLKLVEGENRKERVANRKLCR